MNKILKLDYNMYILLRFKQKYHKIKIKLKKWLNNKLY